MDAGASLDNSTMPSYDVDAEQQEGAAATGFNWQVSDTALLLPSQLGISKVQRAWDRKPKTPFARPGARIGKVWKRAQTAPKTAAVNELVGEGDPRSLKRRKATRSSLGAEKKPLKKMCLDSDFGLAPRVLAWEGAESPARKIVTRRSATNEELLALPDEEEGDGVEEDQGDVTIEILDEDGTVLDVNPESGAEEPEWEDEEPVEEDEFNDTMMHLAEIIDSQEPSPLEIPQIDAEELPLVEDMENLPEIEQENQDPALLQLPEIPPPLQQASGPIPEGFVSPVKQQSVPVVKNRRRSLGGPRRRTLPRMFAPSPLSQVMNMEESFHEPAHETEMASPSVVKSAAVNQPDSLPKQDAPAENDGQWEDVSGSSSPLQAGGSDDVDLPVATLDAQEHEASTNLLDEQMDGTNDPEESDNDNVDESSQSNSPQHVQDLSTSKSLTSSPIPTIEGQHPRLPLRRSPRRKSSSPVKQRKILPSTEKPHLVAFTPVKGFAGFTLPSTNNQADHELPHAADVQEELASPLLGRSVSAPPEEPQISPRKPAKPRVSDDTALLQAFLNRAAENRGSRRMSAQKRESITNRRDSDAVKQALQESVASPAKTADVLGELDVNSPSPRKPSAPASDVSAAFDEVIHEAAAKAEQEVEEDSTVGHRTRRSGRGTKKAQPATPAAPNKISIRGNSEGVVLKRSEAQEMAMLTRNNTRKNKGGAVLPPLRLTKMVAQFGNTELDATAESTGAANKKADGRKGVKWSETLVEFFQGGDMSESSVLSDELNAPPAQADQSTEKMEVDTSGAGSAPPPSETPSKPKIRKLKAARTAGTPGKVPAAPEAAPEQEKPPPPPDAKPTAQTKRRSRIATPARGLTNASLLPSDLDPQPVVPAPTSSTATENKKPALASKKRAPPVSKLPGPASSTSSLGQGKENLIASPAKKKPLSTLPPPSANTRNAVPSAKNFAPRLDFSASTKLAPNASGEGEVPGLMSPAKKGGRTKNVFTGSVNGESEDTGRTELPPGLSSPAKKRTRRAVN